MVSAVRSTFVACLALLFALILVVAAVPGAGAAGPSSIELLSPQQDDTVVGNLTIRAKVVGPAPDEVQIHLNNPPKGWQKAGIEVAPGIWEAAYDLATLPYGTYSAQVWAVTGSSSLPSETVTFTVDRELSVHWVGDLPLPTSFSPDGDGTADDLGLAVHSELVTYDPAAADLWVDDPAGTRLATVAPWFSGTDPFGTGVTAAAWNGQNTAGIVVPDGWYCVRFTVTAKNGRHGSIAQPIRVDAAPAESPVPPQPAGAWCAPALVAVDPPLVPTPYPPLPDPASTTPADTRPTTPTDTTPTVLQSETAPAVPAPASGPTPTPKPLPPTGKQFTTKPLLSVRSATRAKGKLKVVVRCVSGCTPGQSINLELWTRAAAPQRKLAVRVRVSRAGTLTISRAVRGTLPKVLELRAPQFGTELPIRLR